MDMHVDETGHQRSLAQVDPSRACGQNGSSRVACCHLHDASIGDHDDGIVDPRDTRKVLGFCLSICREAGLRPLKPITFGVGRM